MKKGFGLFAAALLAASAGVVSATDTYNFDTDQSASFTTVIHSGDSDASANFVYDYSTHVQYGGIVAGTFPDIPITSAPNSTGGTTKGLKLKANSLAGTDTDAVTVYPVVTALGANWDMTWDSWENYGGAAGGDSGNGSTEFMIFGAADTTSVAPFIGSPTGTGYFFTMTGEGGAALDIRYYSGSGTIAQNTPGITFMNGSTGNTGVDAFWNGPTPTAFFPQPTYQTLGTPGKAWVTFRLRVNGTTATFAIKRVGDSNFTNIATATVPAGAVRPFVGYSDLNAGVPQDTANSVGASVVADQFIVIDNLIIANTAGVSDWTNY